MSDSELVSTLYLNQLQKWVGISMNALAVFEFVTTLDQEVVSVWKRKWTGASLLLVAVRYTMLAVAIGNCVTFVNMNYQGCVTMSITTNILILLDCLLTALFSALRVYALCGGSIRLSAATLLLQVSPIIVNSYSYIGDTYTSDPVVGCLFSYPFGLKTQEILVLASRIPLALGDALVVIITWMKSFQQFKVQRNLGMHLPLSTLLFRDGTVYFLILLILNILEPCPLTSSDAGYVISELNGSLPLILVNRFMLNLRQLSDDETRSAPHIRTITTPIFQMSIDIAGNIGESLEHGYETEARGEDGVELQVGQQDEEMLELQESLCDDRHNTQEVPQGDEEAGPSRCLSE